MAKSNLFIFLQRVRGRKATSNPTSPIPEPKRALSNPEDITQRSTGLYQSIDVENHVGLPKRNGCPHQGIEHIATVPKGRHRNIPTAQSVFEHEHCCSSNSNSSSYDNVGIGGTARRKQKVECDNQCPHYTLTSSSTPKTKYKPIGEREIPFSEYQQLKCRQKQEDPYSSGGSSKNTLERQQKVTSGNESSEYRDPDYEEVRQFSREPTCIQLSSHGEEETTTKVTKTVTESPYATAASVKKAAQENPYTTVTKSKNTTEDTESTIVKKISLNTQPPSKSTTDNDSSKVGLLSPPRKSMSSSSCEWPPPPDSLEEPSSPFSPGLPGAFDSNTLKRMLQNLPECSASPSSQHDNNNGTGEHPFEFRTLPKSNSNHNGKFVSGRPPLSRDNSVNSNQHAMIKSAPDTSVYMQQPLELKSPPTKPSRMGLESVDYKYGKSKMRDSYPDSGISGMTNDTTGSVKSGDSGRSGHSGRSTLPPGLNCFFLHKILISMQ